MQSEPKVTVLMPVYNAELYLREAIESILFQTYPNFEFIIINDGSTDSSADIVADFRDDRIRLIHNDRNRGIIYTLNRGIRLARGEFIARMDADDISLPKRLENQLRFMEVNPTVAVSGGGIIEFDGNGCKVHKMPEDPRSIRTNLLFHCVLMHPTVMMRKSIITGEGFFYSEKYRSVEDFELWQRISFRHDLANIPNILLKYRIVQTSITQTAEKKIQQRDQAHEMIYASGLKHLGVEFRKKHLHALRRFLKARPDFNNEEFIIIEHLLRKIREKIDSKQHNPIVFDVLVAKHFLYFIKFYVKDGDIARWNRNIRISTQYHKFHFFSRYGLLQNSANPIFRIILRLIFTLLHR